MKELTKEEIQQLAKDKIGDTFVGSANIKDELIECFIDAYTLANQNTKLLVDEIAKLKEQLKAADSVNEQRIGELQNFVSLVVNSYKLVTDANRPKDVLYSLQIKAGDILTQSNQTK